MAGEWHKVTVGEFATFAYGKGLPEHQRDPSGDVPVFGSNGVVGFHNEALTAVPAVIIGRKGTVGAVHYSSKPCWPIDTTFYVIDPDADVLRFKYYLLKSLGLEHMNADSAVPGLNRDAAHARKVLVPPLSEQRAIAHVLGTLDDDIQAKGGECKGMRRILAHLINKLVSGAWSVEQGQEWLAWARSLIEPLDDKIELNRRMSETLEAMARALFKSWFVDFDPVRAKAEGRDPGLPKPLADLFPARLVDSELGEIPEGWEVKPIGELAEVVGGSTPKTERGEYWEGGTHHWVTPKDLSALAMPVLFDTERRITDAGLAQISSGLLPKGTVLLSSRAPIGYLAVAEVPVAVNQGFIAMKPREGISNLFLLRWAGAAHDEIVSHANGSTFLEISKANFRPIRVVAPTRPVMDAFDRLSRPFYRLVVEHERESRTLAALRDALLPELISGELRVKDAERFMERRGIA